MSLSPRAPGVQAVAVSVVVAEASVVALLGQTVELQDRLTHTGSVHTHLVLPAGSPIGYHTEVRDAQSYQGQMIAYAPAQEILILQVSRSYRSMIRHLGEKFDVYALYPAA